LFQHSGKIVGEQWARKRRAKEADAVRLLAQLLAARGGAHAMQPDLLFASDGFQEASGLFFRAGSSGRSGAGVFHAAVIGKGIAPQRKG
jgi:hypothetical protein